MVLRLVAEQHAEREVPLSADGASSATFWLAIWRGDDDPLTEEILDNMSGPVDNHQVFYAADYDRNHDFHVNTWPEVALLLDP